jgi:hypothetical protein
MIFSYPHTILANKLDMKILIRFLKNVFRPTKYILTSFFEKYFSIPIGPIQLHASNKGNVAICYLNSPYKGEFNKNLPNKNNIRNIAGVFLELGYSVYLYDFNVNYDQKYFQIKFDIIFGFGNSFKNLASNKNNLNAIKIGYFTELPGEFNEKLERARTKILKNKGYHVRNDNLRSGVYYKKSHFKFLTHLILTGSETQLEYFKSYNCKKKFAIQPSTVLDKSNINPKNLPFTRKNAFCWIGSRGGVIKGLDLLIEAFSKKPEIELHLFGMSFEDRTLFARTLPNNIINHGFCDATSKKFYDIVSNCKFVISTSFSEGSTTGVLTGMCLGCVPVVSKYSGTPMQIETIDSHLIEKLDTTTLTKRIDKSLDWYKKNCSKDIHEIISRNSLENFSSSGFRRRFSYTLRRILNE